MAFTLVESAQAMALLYHAGQINKHDQEPYILHVHRVAVSVAHDPRLGDMHLATAWLHDTLEDTVISPLDLFSTLSNTGDSSVAADILTAVRALTKQKGETNEDYYHRVLANEIAREVKIHDIYDNFGRTHRISDPQTRARLAEKYSLGIDILKRQG